MSDIPESQNEPTSLQGLRVIISGGTTGIGRATAHQLVASGADVFVFGRHEQELRDTLDEAPEGEGTLSGTVADQADPADVARVFDEARAELGRIDVLVNNAAIAGDELMEGGDEAVARMVAANVTGYILCTRHALRAMEEQGGGHIVVVGSMSAEKRAAEGEVYTATKAANRGFADSLRRGYGPKGVRVTLIEPGKTGTDLLETPPDEQREKEEAEEMMTAEDVAECIVFALTRPARVSVARIQVVPTRHQS